MNTADGQHDHSISAEQVAAWLRHHPNFFREHEDVLDGLSIPHLHTGGAVSLLERLVQRQRDQYRELQERQSDMLKAARDSEHVIARLHHLALELMTCDSLDDVVGTCNHMLRGDFKADNVVLRLIGHGRTRNGLHFIDPDDKYLKQLATLFRKRQPVCGRLRPRQQMFLFGDEGASIKSAVLIPLFEAREIGVLALGSENEARFYPGMGTLFIGQLGGLVARALARYLEPPLHTVEMGS
ncbi:DUF484 family protein [Thiothrix subterranea]|uniref:DUF484 family protein n=1 Tax=Thiothrix subterranea TaxID=2735563 RepID=A0AA51R2A0_9GAMM|nr:DUF484 family protein [Thiothrix subterranea]MDQ5768510.1 DUF484 family protein [Thiothrix subterranea]QQZ29076.1 DUF484 family protein [Thiothrix subterranea]WML87609.1 DUF484 family protein [Thiothrix subterranea]